MEHSINTEETEEDETEMVEPYFDLASHDDGKKNSFLSKESKTKPSTKNLQTTIIKEAREDPVSPINILPKGCDYILEEITKEEEIDQPDYWEILNIVTTLPPPTRTKPIWLKPQQSFKEGWSATGISILAMEGWVGWLEDKPIYLWHDSCADISLISEEYYKQLKNPPVVKRGAKLNLWQLTDKNAEIQGYIRLPIFSETVSGEIIETKVEAYMVPGMSVPILLGEDYQLNYEL